jgi:hypothetical protein
MSLLSDLLGMLVFRVPALRSQSERRTVTGAAACFSAGFLAYALTRNRIYAALPELSRQSAGPIAYLYNLGLLQALVFVLAVYVPALALFSKMVAGKGLGFSVPRREYRLYASAFLPLWGLVFVIAAPVQWMVPHFLILGSFEVSVGYLVRSILVAVYTVWALKHLSGLKTSHACAAFILSWITLPALYLVNSANLA